MNRLTRTSFAAVMAAAACADSAPTTVVPILDAGPAMSLTSSGGSSAVAILSGDQEVPARETSARGSAVFRLSDDASTLSYRLIVANIENVVASHIHLGPAGQNGPVVAFLFGPAGAGGGRVDGVIAEGVITADNLVGPLAGGTLSDLVEQVVAGNTYVNVHTNDGVAPPNTGAGDFPGGEIRGQIR